VIIPQVPVSTEQASVTVQTSTIPNAPGRATRQTGGRHDDHKDGASKDTPSTAAFAALLQVMLPRPVAVPTKPAGDLPMGTSTKADPSGPSPAIAVARSALPTAAAGPATSSDVLPTSSPTVSDPTTGLPFKDESAKPGVLAPVAADVLPKGAVSPTAPKPSLPTAHGKSSVPQIVEDPTATPASVDPKPSAGPDNGVPKNSRPTSTVPAPSPGEVARPSLTNSRGQPPDSRAQSPMPVTSSPTDKTPEGTNIPGRPSVEQLSPPNRASVRSHLSGGHAQSDPGTTGADSNPANAMDPAAVGDPGVAFSPASGAGPAAGATAAQTVDGYSHVPTNSIVEQVRSHLLSQGLNLGPGRKGNSVVVLRLDPPTLGKVLVRIEKGDGAQIQIHFRVEDRAVRDALVSGWSQLDRALRAEGFTPANASVEISPFQTATSDMGNAGQGGSPTGFANQQSAQGANYSLSEAVVGPAETAPSMLSDSGHYVDYRL